MLGLLSEARAFTTITGVLGDLRYNYVHLSHYRYRLSRYCEPIPCTTMNQV